MFGVALAVLLILAPGYDLLSVALPKKSWIVALWLVCAMAGAVFAAFAFAWQCASAARRGLPSFVGAVLVGIGIMAAGALATHHSIGFPLPKVVFLLKQFLLYFTVSFVLEEVAFRGALDSHVYQPRSDGQASGSRWRSAIFVSALWGIWHLPVVPIPNAPALAAASPPLIIVHTLVGLPLSFCWRASGTLVLPAAAHALVDAYRNTVL
jgi:membrane protease YdiL (CAAX protease family)